MTEGPFGAPRPFVRERVVINIRFTKRADDIDISAVREAADDVFIETFRISEPHGRANNVVSVDVGDDEITLEQLTTFRKRIITDNRIREIEIVRDT